MTKFRELAIGQEFDFDGGPHPSFTARCRKTSARGYTPLEGNLKGHKLQVGSINATVYHVGETVRRNPMTRESEPAYQLEAMIDRYSLAKVCDMLAGVCGQKASHIEENWQDTPLANKWDRASGRLRTMAAAFRRGNL